MHETLMKEVEIKGLKETLEKKDFELREVKHELKQLSQDSKGQPSQIDSNMSQQAHKQI